MKQKWLVSSGIIALIMVLFGSALVLAQEGTTQSISVAAVNTGTAFTYQGRLTDGGSPANGVYDFQFTAYDAATGGNNVGSTTVQDVTVTDGLFTASVDLGNIFDGTALWLALGVRLGTDTGAFTTLDPRQAVTAAPVAQTLRPGAFVDGSVYEPILSVTNNGNGNGVVGNATATSGTTYGVYGTSASTTGKGVYGKATATSGEAYGVQGESPSTSGRGVFGYATTNTGTTYGVFGASASSSGIGVYGNALALSGTTYGVKGTSSSTSGRGVYGDATATSGYTYGVWGDIHSLNGKAIYGHANGSGGHAGYFVGTVHVSGNFDATGSKSFKIDHPLDPQNMYLYHYSVESSEVLNQYSGKVILDSTGSAWVQLPDWFEAINQDFRYQLTSIGAPGPNLYIAQEISGNRFQIAGGEPGAKVSWEVTAQRNDPYMQQNPHPVEVPKTGDEIGTYLYPQGYGQPEIMGLDFQTDAALGTETGATNNGQ